MLVLPIPTTPEVERGFAHIYTLTILKFEIQWHIISYTTPMNDKHLGWLECNGCILWQYLGE